MNIEQLNYLRVNTIELIKDYSLINWLIKLDNNYLKEISNNIELTSIKNREQFNFINYLINSRY
jgi:hypothetical protein